ncbi:hypothetical protein BD769DRAFT_1382492 [Suillus cothurnatus]|nr:hypothetical protein BD769DRAFT_1382492 [Suillus cothurnatus]
MKDKEPTSLKAISQTTRPYPSTPRPSSQTPRTGPRYFLQNVLTNDDDMEQPLSILPEYPSSPTSPPDTPTPAHREISEPSQPADLLVFREFAVTTTTPQEITAIDAKDSDLNKSMHAPGNVMVDQTMDAPPSPPTSRVQTVERGNHPRSPRASRCKPLCPKPKRNQPPHNPTTVHPHANWWLPKDNKVLLAWFQVEHPKFMVRVFNLSGKDVVENTAITAERIRVSISIIADFVHQEAPPIRVSPPQPQGRRGAKEFPVGFLVHKISEEARNLIVNQRIWSSTNITFEALPFNCPSPPELLFCLSGFTTSDANIVRKAIIDVWAHDDNRHHIDDAFSMCGFPDDELVYQATRDLIHSVRVETLDFKVTGGLSVPRFNIFATSPTNNAKTWTELRGFLRILEYPTGLDGCGIAAALFPCQICHSLAHPRGLCPFPLTPQWNGPKLNNRSTANSTRLPGRNRGGR